jgi:hypothetical protein
MNLIELNKVNKIANVNLLKKTSGKTPKTELVDSTVPVTEVKPDKIPKSSLKILFVTAQTAENWSEISPMGNNRT